jgi:HEAT repeat protein
VRKLLVLVLACVPLAGAVLAMPSDPTAVNLLVQRQKLSDESKEVRLAAIKQLGSWGTAASLAAPDLAQMLTDNNEEIANQAALALAEIGPAAVKELVKAAKPPALASVRQRALLALSKMGPDAKEALSTLREALQDRHTPCRSLAAIALGELGADAKAAIPELSKALGDNDEGVRKQAAIALANIGPESLPALRIMVEDDDWAVRLVGVQALAYHGPEAEELVPDLAKLLTDQVGDVRAGAATALGALGPAAKEAVPQLIEAIKDDRYDVQMAAYQALTWVQADDEQELLKTLRKINAKYQWATPYHLKQFGPNATDAVKPLIKQLEAKEDGHRMAAALALANIGHAAKEAIPALKKALNDPNPQVQHSAAFGLVYVVSDPLTDTNELLHGCLQKLGKGLEKVAADDATAIQNIQRFQQALLANQPLNGSKARSVNRRAMFDPQVQTNYSTIVGVHMMCSAQANSVLHFSTCDNSLIIQTLPDELQVTWLQNRGGLTSMEPEGVPAVINGLYQVAYYDLGFT